MNLLHDGCRQAVAKAAHAAVEVLGDPSSGPEARAIAASELTKSTELLRLPPGVRVDSANTEDQRP